ncbi:disulfide bond formation protein DsbB [Motilimonas pumila]|uniref:Disulfide bond formation protein B n=2 Tax=Motilimonas pumila TaxID=2303987 RepID=A0A418Y9T9_9GAMM|nr:disulfide bond formation protein DsbB [Motilimonas pumila]
MVMDFLKTFASKRLSWLLLAGSAFMLELTAIYFQHVMSLQPCIMCVYERLVMVGLISAGLIGCINPKQKYIRWPSFMLWGYSALQGVSLAKTHVYVQSNYTPETHCDLVPNFPSWIPLHEWMPWMFQPTGTCAEIAWQFLGLSMPQWLVIIFSVYSITFVVFLVPQLLKR